ncbi:MAG: tetratricopeptide repeat protein [Candidatus Eisenbacteria bacterium]
MDEAEQVSQEALTLTVQLYGEHHASTARARTTVAGIVRGRGRLREAEPLFRQIVDYWVRHEGRTHPYAVSSIANLAATLRDLGRFEEAEPLQREVVEQMSVHLGDRHPHYGRCLVHLAATLLHTDRLEEAGHLLTQAYDVASSAHGENHPEVTHVLHHQARLADRCQTWDAARESYDRVTARYRQELGPEHPTTLVAQAERAAVLVRLGDVTAGERALREALSQLSSRVPRPHPDLAWVNLELASALHLQARESEARPYFQEALALRRLLYGSPDHGPGSARARELQAMLLPDTPVAPD